MSDTLKPPTGGLRSSGSLVWVGLLVGWLVFLCLVPDPRPFGAPEWAVRGMRSVAGVSESTARVAATIALRGLGVGLIGVLLVLSLKPLRMRSATPLAMAAAVLLAVGAKWINFGNFPITSQLRFIVVAAIMGVLAGLVLRRNWIALAGGVMLAIGLVAWGSSTGVADDLYETARVTGIHVLDNAEDVSESKDSFVQLLEVAFAYAEDNSHGTDAVLPNRAAILALGVLLGEDRVAWVARRQIDPDRQEERVALRRGVTVHGRRDLAQHFWVSAALTVLSDEQRALTVGIAKEMMDSAPGGSGFSFVDMAANKAGIRFASTATRNAASAREIQLLVAEGVNIEDFFPDVSHLPEGITRDRLQSEFGGVGGEKTRKLFEEIDRRLGASRAFQ